MVNAGRASSIAGVGRRAVGGAESPALSTGSTARVGSGKLVGRVKNKLEELRALVRSYGSCLVAYSGGVDSAFLACVAAEALGSRALAAIADSPSLPRQELEEAVLLAEARQFPLRVVRTREFDNPAYLANPSNRCYFCKHELFTELEELARNEGFAVIAYGENASDIGDHRPGAGAAAEFSVRAPLKELGFTKDEIRKYSTEMGLPTAEKPQMACLSSRIPHGEAVTPEKLMMIERGERVLREAGFVDVRVRHHEIKSGSLARVEVGAGEMGRFFEAGRMEAVAAAFREFGYAQVTLDMLGYRRGGVGAPIAPGGVR